MSDLWNFLISFFDISILITVATTLFLVVFVSTGRGTFAFIGNYGARLAYAIYYYYHNDFPDMMNVTLNLVYEEENSETGEKELWFDIDSLIADSLLTEVFRNAYVAYVVRNQFFTTTRDDPLVRFDLPKRRKTRWCNFKHKKYKGKSWARKRSMLVKATERRYDMVYNPIISLIGQFSTNDAAMAHAVGIPHSVHTFIVALTYERGIDERAQHGRVMVIPEQTLLNMPAECPKVPHKNYIHRFNTMKQLAEDYKKAPHEFRTLRVRIPKQQAMSMSQHDIKGLAKLLKAEFAKAA